MKCGFEETIMFDVFLKNDFNKVKESYDNLRRRAKQQLKVAHQATDTPEGSELSPELKEVSRMFLDCTPHDYIYNRLEKLHFNPLN